MNSKAVEKALSLVGQGYIYGAKGQTCTPEFRQQQAEQYPEQADNILNTGKKWDGVPVWDCAQLTRAVAKAAGVTLVSGATSQWNKTDWVQKGAIDTIPAGKTVLVYRQSGGKMQHTGVALGDGTCVHARGTAYGVVRQGMNEHAWTHWALPAWDAEDEDVSLDVIYEAKVTASKGKTVNMRKEPGGSIIEQVPIGTVVDVLAEAGAGWAKIVYDMQTGYMQTAFLQKEDADGQTVTLTMDKSAAQALHRALSEVLGNG